MSRVKRFLFVGLVVLCLYTVWGFFSSPIPNEAAAENLAMRAFITYQSSHTNVVFPPPYTVKDEGDKWVVSSTEGLSVIIEKKTQKCTFDPIEEEEPR